MSGPSLRSLCSTCLRARSRLPSKGVPPLSLQPHVARNMASDATASRRTSKRKVEAPRTKEGGDLKDNLLQKTKVEEFLRHIASTSHEVTLADIERHRPLRIPSEYNSGYEQKFRSVLETLVRSFSLDQLSHFLALYHLDPPAKRNKWQFASTIIEHAWKWPSLSAARKSERDRTEVVYKSFPLDTRQAFLLLGKDGKNLLALSSKYNIHVSFSKNPLSLKVEGLLGSINGLSQHIDNFKDGIEEELFSLPSGHTIPSDTLQRISRLSGVFLEDTGNGIIRLSHTSMEDGQVHLAKRLMMLAVFEATHTVPIFVQAEDTSMPSVTDGTYSLYPFAPPGGFIRVSGMGNPFRIRHVGQRSGIVTYPEARGTVSLAQNEVLNLFGERIDLKDILLNGASSGGVTASFGHLLASADSSQPSDITPPLKGHQTLSEITTWLKKQSASQLFVPSLPVTGVHSYTGDRRLVYRLLYRNLSTERSEDAGAESMRIFKAEVTLNVLQSNQEKPSLENQDETASLDGNQPSDPSTPMNEHVGLEPICWAGRVKELDLLMPNCTMDIRFSASHGSELAESKWPEDFRTYLGSLRTYFTGAGEGELKQPNPPLVLKHEGTMYGLESCSIVRQVQEPSIEPSIQTIRENLSDVASNQRSTNFQVTCRDISSDSAWSSFLTQCDKFVTPISTRPFTPVNTSMDETVEV